MQTFYITKYALTGGIQEIQAVPRFSDYLDGNSWVHGANRYEIYYVDREAFANCDAAVADADQRRLKKIASLKKQIAKLEALKF